MSCHRIGGEVTFFDTKAGTSDSETGGAEDEDRPKGFDSLVVVGLDATVPAFNTGERNETERTAGRNLARR